jgi:hypothetical protein
MATLAAYAGVRALESGRTRWVALTGVLFGLGFLGKMLAGFLALPALALAYLICGPPGPGKRIWQLLVGGAALLATARWWVAIVLLTPAAGRPFVGSTTDNNILQLTFGYNGLSRLTGNRGGGFGGAARAAGRGLGAGAAGGGAGGAGGAAAGPGSGAGAAARAFGGADSAASMELAIGGIPVMAIGGFRGTDPAPSLAQFEKLVSEHKIHYYVAGGGFGGRGFGGAGGGLGGGLAERGAGGAGGDPAGRGAGGGFGGFGGAGGPGGSSTDAARIGAWVQAHFTAQTVGGMTVYNLTAPAASS